MLFRSKQLPYLERVTPGGHIERIKNNAWNRFFTATPTNVGAPGGIGTDSAGASIRSGMNRFRQARNSIPWKRMFGGEVGKPGEAGYRQFKGINNTAGAAIGASMALGLASNFMPEASQGALALGSAVAMVNPVAGAAIGLIGGAITGFIGAAKKKKKEARMAAQSTAEDIMKDTIGGMVESIRKYKRNNQFSEAARRKIMEDTAAKMQQNVYDAQAGSRAGASALQAAAKKRGIMLNNPDKLFSTTAGDMVDDAAKKDLLKIGRAHV